MFNLWILFRKPITFNVIYKFPKQPAKEKQQPVKCVIADDTGLITLLVSSKDEKSYDFLKVCDFYVFIKFFELQKFTINDTKYMHFSG